MNRRHEFGDWQTPIELAAAALSRAASSLDEPPALVLEPTCGEGSFLAAAADRFPSARLLGYELDASYANKARSRLGASRAVIHVADFFGVAWEREMAELPEPILVTGNPPWVTNAALGSIGSANLPDKWNFKGLSGLEALTGKSNFDVSEWMIIRLLAALRGRRAALAMLCKSAVARRVIEYAANRWGLKPGGIWRIDAKRYFDAAVDASLFVCRLDGATASGRAAEWPVYASLSTTSADSEMAMLDGMLVADAERASRTAHLVGSCDPEWRSGLKHDCSRVMELEVTHAGLRNGLGEIVQLDDEFVFPLVKSSDVANGNGHSRRMVVVPQRALGDDTSIIEQRAPRTWKYLTTHRNLLDARKSSIYRGQPAFAIFGVGPYSFAPWKVAVSGLYKRCEFALIGPRGRSPVMLDDTCYFLPFESEDRARRALEALRSPIAMDFFSGRIFWDAKRPINKAILQALDLQALLDGGRRRKPTQQVIAF